MSAELAITISFGVVASGIGGIQIWQGRKRRERDTPTPADSATAQPLREEAVTALLDAYMNLTRFEPKDHPALWGGMKEFETQHGDLAKLRVRLRIAKGIGDQEEAVFTEAFERVSALCEATAILYARRFDLENTSQADKELEEALEATAHAEEAFQRTFSQFEKTVKEAAVRG